jgi:hypothetical protein
MTGETDEERSRREAKDVAEAIQRNQGNALWQGCGIWIALVLLLAVVIAVL